MSARHLFASALIVVLSVSVSAADDINVIIAPGTNFSAFQTFAFRHHQVKTPRPELDNPLFLKTLTRTMRKALLERGLVEVTGVADLLVDFTLVGEDVATTQRGGGRGTGPQPLRFTVGTLMIDMSTPGSTEPVWRGVYREEEPNGSNLVEKLPSDAVKLIERYPKRK